MGNTEINSLFEIAINLESKGLYAQADKARNIMVRLSQGVQSGYDSKTTLPNVPKKTGIFVVDKFLKSLQDSAGFLAFVGASAFIPLVRNNLHLLGLPVAINSVIDATERLDKLERLLPSDFELKSRWSKFLSGEDTTLAQIIENGLFILSDVANVLGTATKFPGFFTWAGIFHTIANNLNVENARELGYWAGGMPGGSSQIKQIESFQPPKKNEFGFYVWDTKNKGTTDSQENEYIKKIMSAIVNDLETNTPKIPDTLGLDFFAPYIKKHDTDKKFEDLLSSQPSNITMKLKTALIDLVKFVKLLKKKNSPTTPTQQKPKGK